MPKRCFSQDRKTNIKYKQLIFNVLYKALIFRVFASEGKSARKYSLIFGGRTENSDRKTAGYKEYGTGPMLLFSAEINNADTGLEPLFLY